MCMLDLQGQLLSSCTPTGSDMLPCWWGMLLMDFRSQPMLVISLSKTEPWLDMGVTLGVIVPLFDLQTQALSTCRRV